MSMVPRLHIESLSALSQIAWPLDRLITLGSSVASEGQGSGAFHRRDPQFARRGRLKTSAVTSKPLKSRDD